MESITGRPGIPSLCNLGNVEIEIDDLVQMAYLAYFGLKLGDQDKSCALHMVYKTCKERLRFWTNGER